MAVASPYFVNSQHDAAYSVTTWPASLCMVFLPWYTDGVAAVTHAALEPMPPTPVPAGVCC